MLVNETIFGPDDELFWMTSLFSSFIQFDEGENRIDFYCSPVGGVSVSLTSQSNEKSCNAKLHDETDPISDRSACYKPRLIGL